MVCGRFFFLQTLHIPLEQLRCGNVTRPYALALWSGRARLVARGKGIDIKKQAHISPSSETEFCGVDDPHGDTIEIKISIYTENPAFA